MQPHVLRSIHDLLLEHLYKKSVVNNQIVLFKKILSDEQSMYLRFKALKVIENSYDIGPHHSANSLYQWWNNKKNQNYSKTILWSDDEINICTMMRDFLYLKGFSNIIIEPDSAQALNIVEKVKPTLIITDQIKKGISGIEFAHRIKTHPDLKQIPILLFSSVYDTLHFQRSLFCAGLMKPQDLDTIHFFIHTILAGNYQE